MSFSFAEKSPIYVHNSEFLWSWEHLHSDATVCSAYYIFGVWAMTFFFCSYWWFSAYAIVKKQLVTDLQCLTQSLDIPHAAPEPLAHLHFCL